MQSSAEKMSMRRRLPIRQSAWSLASLLFISFLGVISLSARPADPTPGSVTRAEKDGIVLEVKALPEQVEGYRSFEVKATNNAGASRSVHAQIALLTHRGEPAGQCTIYMELASGESRSRTKACKESALSRSFRFEIVRVYPFLLDRQATAE